MATAPHTAEEVRAARMRLGLTNSQLATILDRTPNTVARWQATTTHARIIDPTAARVIRWMLEGWRPPEYPAG